MKKKRKNHSTKKLPTKEQTPVEDRVTPEMIKNIWKTNPLEINDNLFEGESPFTEEELKDAKKSLFPSE